MEDTSRTFLEHLNEFRVRIIRSLVALGIGTVCVYQFVDAVIEYLARPVGKFIYLQPTEAFFVRLKIAMVLGALTAMPICIYQLWGFVVVALTPKEKKSMVWILPTSYILFIMGAAFGFFVLVPAGVQFLLSYGSKVLVAQISIEAYMDFMSTMCLVLGVVFQMPLFSFFVSKIGVLHWRMLSEKRRVAILIIYIASSILTPGPDPVTAIMLAIPMYILFECSIWTSRMANPDRKETEEDILKPDQKQ